MKIVKCIKEDPGFFEVGKYYFYDDPISSVVQYNWANQWFNDYTDYFSDTSLYEKIKFFVLHFPKYFKL